MTRPKEYLDDATPCTECNEEPSERIDRMEPFYICGIPTSCGYGTRLRCWICGKQTSVFSNPMDAYWQWNTEVNVK